MPDETATVIEFPRADDAEDAPVFEPLFEGHRRLAAIVALDVVGYTRMMEADEDGALRRLRWLRQSLVDPAVAAHRGRVFKTMGDGLLIEFASAADAVASAVDIQRGLASAALDRSNGEPLRVRVGIHAGDVVSDGPDVLGDGVNVATRLETIAQPGSIYVSRGVRDSARPAFVDFKDLGERQVKNIKRPIQVFSVAADGIAAGVPGPHKPVRSRWIAGALVTVVAVLIVAVAGGVAVQRGWIGAPKAPPAPWSAQDMRQTFAVLPREDVGTDAVLRDYQDGLVDAISAQFTPNFGSDRIVAATAGAHFLIGIKVRRVGGDAQATVTLTDAGARDQILARTISDPLDQPLDAQRGGVMQLADDLKWAGTEREQRASDAVPPEKRDARDLIILSKFARQSESGIKRRVALVQAAAKLAPTDPNVLVETATILSWGKVNGLPLDPNAELDQARAAAEQVLAQTPDQLAALRALANVYIAQAREEDVLAATDRMLAVSHNDRWAIEEQCFAHLKLGQSAEAAASFERAAPLDSSFFLAGLGTVVRFDQERYGESASWARKALQLLPDGEQSRYDRAAWTLYLASAEALNGRSDAAKQAVRDFQAANPDIRGTGDLLRSNLIPFPQIARDRLIEGLRKAGMRD